MWSGRAFDPNLGEPDRAAPCATPRMLIAKCAKGSGQYHFFEGTEIVLYLIHTYFLMASGSLP